MKNNNKYIAAEDTDESDTEPSETVLRQYETVYRSGALNMLDRGDVARFAHTAGMAELEAAASDTERYIALLKCYYQHRWPTL